MGKSTHGGMVDRSKKMERMKPTFSITTEDLPVIKDWQVGKKYSIELEVELVSLSKGDSYDMMIGEQDKDSKEHSGRFKILSVDSEPGKDDENVDEKGE